MSRKSLRDAISFVLFCVSVSGIELLAQSSQPAFSSDSPESGIAGNAFVVLIPLENSGTGDAANVVVTSAMLGSVSPSAPSIPIPLGPWPAASPKQLVLQFPTSRLVIGSRYLLTIRGTYDSQVGQLGFAVSRILQVTTATGSTLQRHQSMGSTRCHS